MQLHAIACIFNYMLLHHFTCHYMLLQDHWHVMACNYNTIFFIIHVITCACNIIWLLSAPFARAVMVVQWYDQRLNSLATRRRVRIPLTVRASGPGIQVRDTVWVLSPPNLHNRTNAPECQPSLPSRSRSAQNGQKAEASSPFVRAFCSGELSW
jgi:hypothetical protein